MQIEENQKKENIAHKDFSEAIEKGIITREPVFSVGGIDYHGFENGLQMICANRYLQYMEDMQAWSTVGMTYDVSKDYVNETIEQMEKALEDIEDPRLTSKRISEAILTMRIYKEHQEEFNIVSAMLNMCSIAFISPNENPYQIDFSYTARKVLHWQSAIVNNEEDFLLFFWKLSSLEDQNWMTRLTDTTKLWAKEDSELTEKEIERKNHSRNLLILDISKHKGQLEDLRHGQDLLSPAKSSRVMSNLAKLKWNRVASSIISNIST
jgi:hypothetical protein